MPEAMVADQASQNYDNFVQQIQQNGLSLEQYFQFTGTTEETLMIQMRPEAEKNIKNRLVLEAIVKAENIEVSDEKLDEELQRMAELYSMEVEKIKELLGDAEKEQMKKDMALQAAVDFMVENAVEK